MNNTTPKGFKAAFNTLVLVAALGYFVDIYDLILFGVVRVKSLNDLGIVDDLMVKQIGENLINWQMGGMLVGGLVWGVLGDKRGRVTVLFGSILLYSLANIANGFLSKDIFGESVIPAYEILRFVAGFGLAGELGAGITLVSEAMHREDRGYGTMLMVMVGALGGVTAAAFGRIWDWQTSYIIGGVLGLGLLAMRVGTYESGLFQNTKNEAVERGNFFLLFSEKRHFKKYLACILMGIPIWFSVGILVLQAKEFAKLIGIRDLDPKTIGLTAIFWLYIGLALGDIFGGWLSQVLQSRKKVVLGFIIAHALTIVLYVSVRDISLTTYSFLVFILGATTGYWGLFATIASEQFGTNIRATVATTVPNFVRGAIIPITFLFRYFENLFGGVANGQAVVSAALVVGLVCCAIGILAILSLPETFGKELDYVE